MPDAIRLDVHFLKAQFYFDARNTDLPTLHKDASLKDVLLNNKPDTISDVVLESDSVSLLESNSSRYFYFSFHIILVLKIILVVILVFLVLVN